jgi:hypothetical protein
MKSVPNLRTMEVTTSSGQDVRDTNMLKGEAKDSLSGKNTTKEYTTSGGAKTGKLGGENSNS